MPTVLVCGVILCPKCDAGWLEDVGIAIMIRRVGVGITETDEVISF